MAEEYAGQPVVFIEQNTDDSLGNRISRWWQAFYAAGNSGSAYLPQAMANSGHQVADGSIVFPGASTDKFYDAYKAMIDEELARPPQAAIQAHAQRVGDIMQITAWVTIPSQAPPSYTNDAVVGAIVYEDKHVLLTDRFARAAVSTNVYPELQPGETTVITLETEPLNGVDWNNLHTVVYVESRVDSGNGEEIYDMLQAAMAQPAVFSVQPNSITVMVDPGDAVDPSIPLSLSGPALTWMATENLTWLAVSPVTGTIKTSPVITISKDQLTVGWQEGEVTFTADSDGGLQFTEHVSVKAYYGPVERVYLPFILR